MAARMEAKLWSNVEAAARAWNCIIAEPGRLISLCSYPWIDAVKP